MDHFVHPLLSSSLNLKAGGSHRDEGRMAALGKLLQINFDGSPVDTTYRSLYASTYSIDPFFIHFLSPYLL